MAKKSSSLGVPLPKIVLPDVLTISNSMAKDWKSCRRRFFWNYLARLKPKKIVIPFFVGTYFHEGLRAFYEGKSMEKEVPSILKRMEAEARKAVFLTPEEEEDLMMQTAIVAGMLPSYARRYAKDRKKWELQGAEKSFEVPIDDRSSYVGQIDLLVQFDGELWIVEHKTAGRLDKNYIDRLPLDTQITGYTIGAKYAMDRPVAGVVYNVAKKPSIRQKKNESLTQFAARIEGDYSARPDFYFYREQLYRSKGDILHYKKEISELATDVHAKFDIIRKEGPEAALPHFYRNTEVCTIRGRCAYLDICTKGWSKDTARLYEVRKDFNPELSNVQTEGE